MPLQKQNEALHPQSPARISLPTTGISLETSAILDFSLAHAQARDAVHAHLSLPSLLAGLTTLGQQAITIKSAAPDRPTYLRRPDLGRTLSPASIERLKQHSGEPGLTIILADGLSALATDRHALPLLAALLHLLPLPLTPIVIAEQARVALADEIGHLLHSTLTLILLGERPGLTSPDSLGAYLTWAPRPGRTDAERNCISNIRPAGLDYPHAAAKIAALCAEATHLQLTGIALKESDPPTLPNLS